MEDFTVVDDKQVVAVAEIIETDDIFGKDLRSFRVRPDGGPAATPLIFEILAGYFKAD